MPSDMRQTVGEAHRTKLFLTVLTALLDHLTVPLAALGAAWAFQFSVPLGLLFSIVAVCFIGRQLRALECLIHEASHFNWSNRHRRLNDVLAGVLAGIPAGVRIASYRRSHLLHHGRLGSGDDPDRQRYRALDLEELDRGGAAAFGRGVRTRLVAYQRGWLAEVASDPVSPTMPVAWAAVTIALPAALWWGPRGAIVAAVIWLVGHVVVLPVIRLVAESDEHSYTDAVTVFDSTITNLGRVQRWIFHPHSDGFHTVHHLWPGIPHHRLRGLHVALTETDPDGYGRRLRFRRRMLSAPTPSRPV